MDMIHTVRIRPTTMAMAEPVTDTHFLPADPKNLLKAHPGRRTPVIFRSAGLNLAGHLYRPPKAESEEITPGIVMCGPISSVKEQTLPHYAERISDAGYTVLTFDPRSFGESEGEPRAHYDPNRVIEDFTNAVTYLSGRPDIDAEQVGIVGVCMGGGYAVSTAARNRLVRAVVAIAGGYNIGGSFQRMMGTEGFARYFGLVNGLVREEYRTGKVQYIPTIAHGLSEEVPVAVMPLEEAFSYYDRTHRTDAPTWSDKMTAASLEPYFLYNSVVHAPLVAPTPIQFIHGTKDTALLPEYAQQAYDAASDPKELIWIETHNHIELYDQDPYVSIAAAHAIRWLNTYLPDEQRR
jgi:fermentation-respiration switch protein FrsA (DUF1100 family)